MNFKKVSSNLRMEETKQFLSEAREMKKKREINNGSNKIKHHYLPAVKNEENVHAKEYNNEKEQINVGNNDLLYSSNDFDPFVVLPPLKMKTPSLLNMTNMSNQGEERKELNQMMLKIINDFV